MDNGGSTINTDSLIIGITGGIGSGKTYISDRIKTMGFSVFNSDKQANIISNTDDKVKQAIINEFGAESYIEDQLNKEFIAKQIFDNKEQKIKLEQIIHPAVADAFKNWIQEQNKEQQQNILFIESAILFESGFNKFVDKVVVVYAEPKTRINRIIKRDNCTEEQVEKRMQAQICDEQKCNMADYIIYNTATDDYLNKQIFKFIKQIYPN